MGPVLTQKQQKFYITTAIDYPNGTPHLGHAYEKVVTDCYLRWYQMKGHKTFLLTGTDENGQKLIKSAEQSGRPTGAFVDENVEKFRRLCKDLRISVSDFIRTSETRHVKVVQDFWNRLKRNGDIYLDRYSGHYCIACEAFYSESQSNNGNCPVHGTKLTYMEEDGYFFKLSRFQEWITQYLTDHPEFLFPSNIRTEILSRLNGEKVLDLSISRPNQGWGIPVPEDEKHVIYTWFDALLSYLTATLYDDKFQPREGEPLWPANVHVIGKDISWFHAVIWPSMLKSAGYAMPEQVYVHGMVLGSDGKRMSKSLGNGVDPQDCLKEFAVDSFRYYMLKAIPSGQDGAFSTLELARTHNSDLANELGNLVMRVVKLSISTLGKNIPVTKVDFEIDFFPEVDQAMAAREHSKAIGIIWGGIRKLNAYINQQEPWKKKEDRELFHQVMYTSLHNLQTVFMMLWPFIPDSAEKALHMLGWSGPFSFAAFDGEKKDFLLTEGEALFPRIDIKP